ncbi:helix-turn-helix domain-containing protein [Nonomuraea sp. NPDC046570]|uniref:helix-turn-helix domain-containing protein n=1 Tax=Nonomuraea sp. NPDC046570 TaxID=3155255 RepID=UPI003408331B
MAALRALAHPTRLAILDLLRTHDSLTATRCGELLGLSAKTCSYHLHVLARHDLIEVASDAGANQREHPWRRAFDELQVPLTVPSTAGSRQWHDAADGLLEAGLQHNYGLLLRAIGERRSWPQQWQSAATVHTRTVAMTAEQLRAWGLEVERVTREHLDSAATHPSAEQRPVRLVLYGLPHPTPHPQAS